MLLFSWISFIVVCKGTVQRIGSVLLFESALSCIYFDLKWKWGHMWNENSYYNWFDYMYFQRLAKVQTTYRYIIWKEVSSSGRMKASLWLVMMPNLQNMLIHIIFCGENFFQKNSGETSLKHDGHTSSCCIMLENINPLMLYWIKRLLRNKVIENLCRPNIYQFMLYHKHTTPET